MDGILRRHPEFFVKKSEALLAMRTMCMNKPQIQIWFAAYKELLDDLGIKSGSSHFSDSTLNFNFLI